MKLSLSNSSKSIEIDDEDFSRCMLGVWRLNNEATGIIGRVQGVMWTLGQFLLNTKEEVDHINRDIYNNKKSNLRVCTKSQNGQNKSIQSNNTSGYKGVHWNSQKNKWQARIKTPEKHIHIGFYVDVKMAAKAYNTYAKIYFKDFANLNEVS